MLGTEPSAGGTFSFLLSSLFPFFLFLATSESHVTSWGETRRESTHTGTGTRRTQAEKKMVGTREIRDQKKGSGYDDRMREQEKGGAVNKQCEMVTSVQQLPAAARSFQRILCLMPENESFMWSRIQVLRWLPKGQVGWAPSWASMNGWQPEQAGKLGKVVKCLPSLPR
ncbi:hypothetical protein BJ166DRAFT_374411 [Pestalotiopsis sp. NC0098]|nr:hypothetical protein BJ166DRAFT_374411 [Pestalotiopsis sp. NC0098]